MVPRGYWKVVNVLKDYQGVTYIGYLKTYLEMYLEVALVI
jgi:hypothetical protein